MASDYRFIFLLFTLLLSHNIQGAAIPQQGSVSTSLTASLVHSSARTAINNQLEDSEPLSISKTVTASYAHSLPTSIPLAGQSGSNSTVGVSSDNDDDDDDDTSSSKLDLSAGNGASSSGFSSNLLPYNTRNAVASSVPTKVAASGAHPESASSQGLDISPSSSPTTTSGSISPTATQVHVSGDSDKGSDDDSDSSDESIAISAPSASPSSTPSNAAATGDDDSSSSQNQNISGSDNDSASVPMSGASGSASFASQLPTSSSSPSTTDTNIPASKADSSGTLPTLGADNGLVAAGTPCNEFSEGSTNCICGISFQICSSGQWSAIQLVASGTKCTAGISSGIKITSLGSGGVGPQRPGCTPAQGSSPSSGSAGSAASSVTGNNTDDGESDVENNTPSSSGQSIPVSGPSTQVSNSTSPSSPSKFAQATGAASPVTGQGSSPASGSRPSTPSQVPSDSDATSEDEIDNESSSSASGNPASTHSSQTAATSTSSSRVKGSIVVRDFRSHSSPGTMNPLDSEPLENQVENHSYSLDSDMAPAHGAESNGPSKHSGFSNYGQLTSSKSSSKPYFANPFAGYQDADSASDPGSQVSGEQPSVFEVYDRPTPAGGLILMPTQAGSDTGHIYSEPPVHRTHGASSFSYGYEHNSGIIDAYLSPSKSTSTPPIYGSTEGSSLPYQSNENNLDSSLSDEVDVQSVPAISSYSDPAASTAALPEYDDDTYSKTLPYSGSSSSHVNTPFVDDPSTEQSTRPSYFSSSPTGAAGYGYNTGVTEFLNQSTASDDFQSNVPRPTPTSTGSNNFTVFSQLTDAQSNTLLTEASSTSPYHPSETAMSGSLDLTNSTANAAPGQESSVIYDSISSTAINIPELFTSSTAISSPSTTEQSSLATDQASSTVDLASLTTQQPLNTDSSSSFAGSASSTIDALFSSADETKTTNEQTPSNTDALSSTETTSSTFTGQPSSTIQDSVPSTTSSDQSSSTDIPTPTSSNSVSTTASDSSSQDIQPSDEPSAMIIRVGPSTTMGGSIPTFSHPPDSSSTPLDKRSFSGASTTGPYLGSALLGVFGIAIFAFITL